MRHFLIEKDEEGCQVYFFVDGQQVAGACVPGDSGVDAESIAWQIGAAFGDPLPSATIH